MKIKKIISTSLIVSSISYLTFEFISIINSSAKIKGYFHTISELSTPIGQTRNAIPSNFSPLSSLFNTILITNGIIFFISIGYYIIKNVEGKIKPILLILSSTTGISTILVGIFHPHTNPPFIHYAATFLVFSCGNLLILLIGLIRNKQILIYLPIIGIGGAFLSTIIPKSLLGIAERLGIYSLIIFELLIGIEMINKDKNKYLGNE